MADYAPPIPAFDRSATLWTFADLVEHVLSANTLTGSNGERRVVRRAVLDAYRDFPLRDDWGYFTRRGQLTTEASQDDGTVAYDHTGGTYERMLTLTSGTWPANAKWYVVEIDDVPYQVEDRKSSTVVTLTQHSNPGADVASGTAYVAYRNVYPVPLDYRDGTEPQISGSECLSPTYVPAAQLLEQLAISSTPGTHPYCYTVRGGGETYGGRVFEFCPPPSEAKTYDFLYQAQPRPMLPFGSSVEYSTGTVSVSGVTVTGVSTAFESRMVGSVIRFPRSGMNLVPTGQSGTVVDSTDSPYAEQRIITAVGSATSLTIDSTVSGTYSGVKYSVGDPVDIDYSVMPSALLAMCEWYYARTSKQSESERTAKEAAWRREFGRARAADHHAMTNRNHVPASQLYWQLYGQ